MYLDVIGKPRSIKKSLIVAACDYAEKYLDLPCDIDITIEFEKDLDCWGYCMQDDIDEYVITIDKKQSVRNMIATIMHEFVHVEQGVTKKLIYGEGKKSDKWMGKVCKLAYKDQPWEKEAFALEKKMIRNFLRKCKLEGIQL